MSFVNSHSSRLNPILFNLLKSLVYFSVSVGVAAAESHYDTLISNARQGDISPATSWLDGQSRNRELTAAEVTDWLLINGWAGKDAEVIRIWKTYSPTMSLPDPAQRAAAKSYRNLRQWQSSVELWQRVLQRTPRDDDARSGLILTLADAGQTKRSLELATSRVKREPTANHWRELAWVQRIAGQHTDSLFSIMQAMRYAPQDKTLLSDYSDILSRNTISAPALNALKDSKRHVFQTDERQRPRELEAAAELVRLAFITSTTENERFVVADRALARYSSLMNQWRTLPSAKASYRHARIDRLGALLVRYRMEEIISEYQSLLKEGDIPSYARRWVASAYLYVKQPEKAEQILSSVIQEDPSQHVQIVRQGDFFYSLLENEKVEQAARLSAQAEEKTPYKKRVYGLSSFIPNDDWVDIKYLRIQSLVSHNDLPAAQRLAENLALGGPGNQELNIRLAEIYLNRGWPRRAETLLKRAELLEARSFRLETHQGLTALELQEWRQLDQLADDTVARYPDDFSVKRLARLRQVHHMAELRISGAQGLKSDSPAKGMNDTNIDAVLYSPPFADHWRVFSGGAFNQSDFTEGRGIHRTMRGGVEFTDRDNWAEVELSHRNFGFGSDIGASLSYRHDINDFWRVGLNAERLMRSTPLRALKNDVTANGGGAYVRWRQSERRSWQADLSNGWFSDGNRRQEYALSGQERLFSSSFLILDFTPTINWGANSKQAVSYYNPQSYVAVLPAFTLDHLLYRHYQTEWHQEVKAGAGRYWQKGESAGAITTLGYGQRVRWNDVLDMGVSAQWDKRPYDGKREQNVSLSFDLNYRF
ncbi:poly-beta-1,6 N-acetyl-D-glucosamine export porin PgaA [Pectobacterium parmentieri]|uniref:poly-beta-1,6 N-acetyl-D-glucosamine export porin PgaA n=1 Tax=Pectobacterium parmentieri TaxID=1905730 RepID=UPI000CDD896D|nr:poly-beta-1,6 N-acetyl-D-glucosamine export porin PgaA [Pectobacterium parmentieri]AYH08005.1 poly-beta-1,6 N-acetyl-D-glucosamine export porin PgaA [Pectobacterium parmentieri]AYH16757.1 poly-beta-1,6 N-acetyl-D-glucosamine export porin PgaA [Pectobacterium parmentieri]AYH25455.1 poly-beta-1,6 N-acetyl-D-glucosamine export porin PgaA [Pectobacterium parmentieri]MBN3179588.1 poly-beta-1,6 N-acetyl-D-glucosamine export porin PgaA [Pectobacterium parmentieri]POW26724.1 poly-beta-1,6 N-acetyl-